MTSLSIEDADRGEQFVEFMQEQGQTPRPELQRHLQKVYDAPRDRAQACFLLVATGLWNRGVEDFGVVNEVVEMLDTVHDVPQRRELREDITSHLETAYRELDSEGSTNRTDWLHNHRYQHLNTYGSHRQRAEDVTDSLQSLSRCINGHANLDDYLTRHLEEDDLPFDRVFLEMQDVDGFSRLSAFDFLELTCRAAGYRDLHPETPRYAYISSNKPQPGLNLVYAGDRYRDDSEVEGMEVDELLEHLDLERPDIDLLAEALYDIAVTDPELQWDERTAMFDVESCLCNFTK